MPRTRLALVRSGIAHAALAAGAVCGLWLLWPDSWAQYLVSAAWNQGVLLWQREPVSEVLASERLDARQREALARTQAIKAFGRELGLKSTENYETISLAWDKTVWNVTVCAPDAFEPRTVWFPVVGAFPYLGFFDEAAARRHVRRTARGNDAYMRTAGAWSTLGWFRDPILPPMLDWPEHELANTILHELAHATLWVPGSVSFNESFASFVGDKSGHAWILHAYGPDSPQAKELDGLEADRVVFRRLLHETYQSLDAAYRDPANDTRAKLAYKREVLGSLPVRAARLPFRQPERWVRYIQRDPWNNARLYQFHTYNHGPEWFETLYQQEGRDLLRFIARVEAITSHRDAPRDPYAALAAAVGAEPPPAR